MCGGVAIIVKDNISYELLKCNTRNLVAIALKDIQIMIGVYMPYYERSDTSLTEVYVQYNDDL